jgi:hypothetical protein
MIIYADACDITLSEPRLGSIWDQTMWLSGEIQVETRPDHVTQWGDSGRDQTRPDHVTQWGDSGRDQTIWLSGEIQVETRPDQTMWLSGEIQVETRPDHVTQWGDSGRDQTRHQTLLKVDCLLKVPQIEQGATAPYSLDRTGSNSTLFSR